MNVSTKETINFFPRFIRPPVLHFLGQNIENRWPFSTSPPPLFPLSLLLQPPPPDAFIYNCASCANKLLARWALSSWEAGGIRRSKALKRPVCGVSLDPMEGWDDGEPPSGGLRGLAVVCVTHPPRLIPSCFFPLIAFRVLLDYSFRMKPPSPFLSCQKWDRLVKIYHGYR